MAVTDIILTGNRPPEPGQGPFRLATTWALWRYWVRLSTSWGVDLFWIWWGRKLLSDSRKRSLQILRRQRRMASSLNPHIWRHPWVFHRLLGWHWRILWVNSNQPLVQLWGPENICAASRTSSQRAHLRRLPDSVQFLHRLHATVRASWAWHWTSQQNPTHGNRLKVP